MDKSFEKEEKELLLDIQKFYWEYLQEYMAREDADISTVNIGIGLLRGLIYISTKFQFEKEIEFKPIKRTEFEPMLMDSLDWNAKKESWQWLTPTAICRLLDMPATNARKMGRALISLSKKPAFPIERKRTNQSRDYFIPPLLKQDKQVNE